MINMSNKISRAERSGYQMGKAIDEMVHLMYQKNTRKNFFKGIMKALNEAIKGDDHAKI